MWNPYERPSGPARRVLGATAVALVLIVWSILSGFEIMGPSKLPSPWAVAETFGRLAWDAERQESLLWRATSASIGRVFAAALLVVILGVPVGVLMGASPRVNAFLSPLVDPFRSAPVVAFLPIFVIWLGVGEAMKTAFLFFGAVVFLVPMVRDAVVAVPRAYWVSARDLGAKPWECVWHGVLPLAKPRIADAITVAVSVMWTYITVAEFVNADAGLGQLIQNARRLHAMDRVFVGIFVILALALITYEGMMWMKRRLYPWEVDK